MILVPDLVELSGEVDATEVLSAQDAREHLRLDSDEFDDQITASIKAAIQLLEQHLRRPVNQQTRIFYFCAKPCGLEGLRIDPTPIRSIVEVEEIMDDGTWASVEHDVFGLGETSFHLARSVMIYPPATKSWVFESQACSSYVLRIRAEVGFTELPAAIKQAVRITVADWWTQRRSSVAFQLSRVPHNAREIIDAYRWSTPIAV